MCNKMKKADQFLQKKNYKRGILFVLMKANFVHIKSCTKKQEYMLSGADSYILEFKFQEKWWGVDATKDDCSMGCLINHSKNAEYQACVKSKRGKASD